MNFRVSSGSYFLSEEKTILRRKSEPGYIEHRVIRHGQAVQGQHAQHGGDSREQNRHLKRNHYERGPGMRRLAADVQGIIDRIHPILHQVTGAAADQPADQHYERNLVMVESDLFRQTLDGKWAVGVDLLVARCMSLVGCVDQSLSRIEFGHDAVDGIALHGVTLSPPPRAEGCAFRSSRWRAGSEGTG